ncbi:uncharacterized protein MAM_06511 [Metarhizium album ARSEF 1941]|uniref:Uncharacterized protein n=1 Tax=Metarhizium album (strain ARSEF 1941) TaxID=1081103 RepID=A0A0B2WRQ8_METAS|nr:uncharacterized protein MAM_06511 [Metarhizium album ARSEF 1941]KHN95670.1 hypothetical protein MAM_06511 [Metarhizium album ARSEF 1941]
MQGIAILELCTVARDEEKLRALESLVSGFVEALERVIMQQRIQDANELLLRIRQSLFEKIMDKGTAADVDRFQELVQHVAEVAKRRESAMSELIEKEELWGPYLQDLDG